MKCLVHTVLLVVLVNGWNLAYGNSNDLLPRQFSSVIKEGATQVLSEGGSTGGGRTIGDRLYDRHRNDGFQTLSQTQIVALDSYDQIVRPLISHIRNRVPGLSFVLENSLTAKKWGYDNRDFSCPDKVQFSGTEVVICQSAFRVRIHEEKFQSKSIETRGELIFHEMVRYVASLLKLRHESVYELTYELLEYPSEVEIVRALEMFGYGDFLTMSMKNKIDQFLIRHAEEINKHYCMGSKPNERSQIRTYLNDWREFIKSLSPGANHYARTVEGRFNLIIESYADEHLASFGKEVNRAASCNSLRHWISQNS